MDEVCSTIGRLLLAASAGEVARDLIDPNASNSFGGDDENTDTGANRSSAAAAAAASASAAGRFEMCRWLAQEALERVEAASLEELVEGLQRWRGESSKLASQAPTSRRKEGRCGGRIVVVVVVVVVVVFVFFFVVVVFVLVAACAPRRLLSTAGRGLSRALAERVAGAAKHSRGLG